MPPHQYSSSSPQIHPAVLIAASLVLLALSAVLIVRRHLARAEPASPSLLVGKIELAKIEKLTTPASFDELCRGMRDSEEKFEACRRKLPVFGRTHAWINTDLLLKEGEDLNTDHLGLLYGVTDERDEATRLALAAVLAAECRRGAPTTPAPFENLFEERCKGSLPTLAQLGIEIDTAWLAGGEVVP